MDFSEKAILILFIALMVPFVAIFYLANWPINNLDLGQVGILKEGASILTAIMGTQDRPEKTVTLLDNPLDFSKQLANPPSIVRGVYVTASTAGQERSLKYFDGLVTNTEVNSIVVDLKDGSGNIAYKTDSNLLKNYNTYNGSYFDINSLVKRYHDQGVYLIGRIFVFKDDSLARARPDLAVYDKAKLAEGQKALWPDAANAVWLDPASEEVWDYNIALAKDAINHGFDEINFDYIRFPADGNMDNAGYPFWSQTISRRAVMKGFFQRLRSQLPGVKLSADLFGFSLVEKNDVGIGQQLEDALEYFDYVSPMVYPSHYSKGFLGYANPADYPYEVVKNSIDGAIVRSEDLQKLRESLAKKKNENPFAVALALSDNLIIWSEGGANGRNKINDIFEAKLRPWLQDFNMGATYDDKMIKQEIKAVQDATGKEYCGYMLWNANNVYTKGAIEKPVI